MNAPKPAHPHNNVAVRVLRGSLASQNTRRTFKGGRSNSSSWVIIFSFGSQIFNFVDFFFRLLIKLAA